MNNQSSHSRWYTHKSVFKLMLDIFGKLCCLLAFFVLTTIDHLLWIVWFSAIIFFLVWVAIFLAASCQNLCQMTRQLDTPFHLFAPCQSLFLLRRHSNKDSHEWWSKLLSYSWRKKVYHHFNPHAFQGVLLPSFSSPINPSKQATKKTRTISHKDRLHCANQTLLFGH